MPTLRQLFAEACRLRLMRALEELLAQAGFRRVAGVDEVGRGCLAGPVVAAAVVVDPRVLVPGVDDSKALTPEERERLATEVRRTALAWAVAEVSPAVIDQVNILEASRRAMRQALLDLRPEPDCALVDAVALRGLPFPCLPLVRADASSYAVACASIVAKVARDRLLADCHRRWPVYGFDTNKGYPTAFHMQALRVHGLSPIHRLSFPRVWEEADAMGPLYREIRDRLAEADSPASLESAEFAFDAARASLHASEEKLLQRLLESRRETLAELGATL